MAAHPRRSSSPQVDGRTVTLGDGSTRDPAHGGATVADQSIGGFVGFLHGLLDPNLAFIFFWLGLALIVLELLVPGHIFSGTVGTIMLVLAVRVLRAPAGAADRRIPALVGAAVFLIVEASHPGLGIWGILGLDLPGPGRLVPLRPFDGHRRLAWVIAPVAVLVGLFFGLVVVKARKLREMPARRARGDRGSGGDRAWAPDSTRNGVVRVNAEQWQAVSTGGRIPAGTRVRASGSTACAHRRAPVRIGPTRGGQRTSRPVHRRKGKQRDGPAPHRARP